MEHAAACVPHDGSAHGAPSAPASRDPQSAYPFLRDTAPGLAASSAALHSDARFQPASFCSSFCIRPYSCQAMHSSFPCSCCARAAGLVEMGFQQKRQFSFSSPPRGGSAGTAGRVACGDNSTGDSFVSGCAFADSPFRPRASSADLLTRDERARREWLLGDLRMDLFACLAATWRRIDESADTSE